MKTPELLDAAKVALKVESDYALAKATGLSKQRITDYRSGRMQPDAYAAARLAVALGRDPLEVIAEIEAEHARTETQRTWWRGFLSSGRRSAKKAVKGLLNFSAFCLAVAGLTAGTASEVQARTLAAAPHNVHYVKSCASVTKMGHLVSGCQP